MNIQKIAARFDEGVVFHLVSETVVSRSPVSTRWHYRTRDGKKEVWLTSQPTIPFEYQIIRNGVGTPTANQLLERLIEAMIDKRPYDTLEV